MYALMDSNTCQPFYVGKGNGKRAWKHLKQHTDDCHNSRKNKLIKELGACIDVIILESNLSESLALQVEKDLIKLLGRSHIDTHGILSNITEGGTNPPHGRKQSALTRHKISETRKERHIVPSQTAHEAAVAANRGREPWNKNGSLPLEVIQTRQNTRRINTHLIQNGMYSEVLDLAPHQGARRRLILQIRRTGYTGLLPYDE